jgi:xylan 1,4-beta-xylosidase
MWNNVLPEIKDQPVWNESLYLPLEDVSEYTIQQAKIKEEQGSPYESWLKMGKPSNLSPFEEEYLRGKSEMEYSLLDFSIEDGSIRVSLNPDEVLYLEIKKKEDANVVIAADMDLQAKLRTY